MQRQTPQTSLNIVFVVVMYPEITKIENFGVRNWQNKTTKYNIKFLWKNEIPQYMKKCKFLGTFNVKNKKNKLQNNWIIGKSTPKKEAYEISGYASIFLTRKSYQISCIQMICDAIKKGIPQQT